MLETTVAEYLHACSRMDRDSFCQQVAYPVLVLQKSFEGLAFHSLVTQRTNLDEDRRPVRPKPLEERQQVFELRKNPPGSSPFVTIGRAEECDVLVESQTVSAQHAVFYGDDLLGVCFLKDLGSTNQTFVNQAPIRPKRFLELHDRDLVTLGEIVFVFFTPRGFYDELSRWLTSTVR